jgi:excisionase family DNA binding protein
MTNLHHPVSADMIPSGNENISLSEELHHVSELLEELIHLLKGSTNQTEKIISEKLSPKESEVMTVKEAAAVMRISLPMMYEFARSGRVHAINVGRRVLISRSSLMALLREGEHNGQ